jgi:tetratricopeptide (TPR) repeat protein
MLFILAVGFLCASSESRAAVPPPEEGFTWETLRSAEKALQRAREPWKLSESFLEAGDRRVVESFLEKLTEPRQEPARRRIAYLLKLYAGDYVGAADEIAPLPATDPWTASQQDYISRLLKATAGFVENPSEHFRVWTSSDHIFLAESAIRALEKAYASLFEAFGVVPSTSVLAEIYPAVEAFSDASTLSEETLERSGAIGICKFRRLMILSPRSTPLGYRWLDALAHEYVHLIVNRISGTLCPLWLHEGVARYYETAWRRAGPFSHPPAEETMLARAAMDVGETSDEKEGPSLIPFRRMEPSMVYLENQEEVSLAFAEVSDAVSYLVNGYGEQKLGELLAAFREKPRDVAFQSVLGATEAEVEAAWRDSLKDREWTISKGAMAQVIRFRPADEEDFVGADARGHIRLGDRLRRQGQFQAAQIQYEKALAQEPDNGVALTKLARTHVTLEKEEKAEAALRRAIEKNPSYVTPAVMLGELLYEQGRYEEAQPVLHEALEINPFHPRIHEYLGLIALDLGNFAAARQAVELSLRLDPSNAELRSILDRMPGAK